ncbi:MAG: GNAT family N-acetyltransferase [Candidatus Thorarchaeota archaeon]|nr:MAG: GNAT family N-acetyltransferase [Candidatus Thorarchaeota archaeon]
MKGKGIGSAMFYKILLAMKEAGFKFAFMDSGMTQVDAIKMYERFGFTIQRKQNAWIKKIE